MRIIEVVEYQASWAQGFSVAQASLKRVLGDNAIHIEHVGSTSVVGLAAKPIIDILVEVKSLPALDAQQLAMQRLGYLAKGENGIAGRRYYEKGGDARTHHIHAFEQGSDQLLRHRAFRDYLNVNPEVCQAYAQLKKTAALRCNNDASQYAADKQAFVSWHEQAALALCASGSLTD